MAEQQVLDARQGVTDEFDAPRREREARQQQEAAADHQRKIDSGYVPTTNPDGSVSYQMAPDMEPLTAQELRARKQNPLSEPGPATVDGSPITPPRQFRTEREARAYNTRTPVTDDNRAQRKATDAAYLPSPRDEANADRGFYSVYRPDGTVGLSVGVGYEQQGAPMSSKDAAVAQGGGIPGGLGRNGPRADLEPGFELVPERGPNGTVYVYRQNEESRAKQENYNKERQLYRRAAEAGVTPAEFAAQNPGVYGNLAADDEAKARMQVQAGRQGKADKREEAWRAQMMLGGGRPTGGIGGSKATVNAWLNLPEDQRASAMRYMLPGGQLSATVDANNAAQAGRMAQAAMTAFLNGQNSGQLNPLQQQQLAQMQSQLPAAEQVPLHKDKPGVHQSELQYADDYVGTHYSSGGGMFGISSEFTMAEQQAVIDHLVNDMGYSPAKAQKIVDEIARRRNAGSWMGSPVRNAAPGAAPGSAAPPPAPPPGSDPRAWGGGA
jgi:hypothetical protein